MARERRRKLSWGTGMAILITAFALFILVFVGIASLQSIDLVDRDYYAKGLAYEAHLEKMRRAALLEAEPTVAYDGDRGEFIVIFPSSLPAEKLSGSVTMYFPANSRYDRVAAIEFDTDGLMRIDAAGLPSGPWKAKIDWQYDGTTFFTERTISIE